MSKQLPKQSTTHRVMGDDDDGRRRPTIDLRLTTPSSSSRAEHEIRDYTCRLGVTPVRRTAAICHTQYSIRLAVLR
jgi:hypothetical protein